MISPGQTLVAPALVAPLVALALMCETVAWALAAQVGTLGPGFWYGRGDLLAAVHLVTVGTLALAIVGTGWQLVPVVTARPPGRAWSAVAHGVNLVLAVGLVGLVAGFSWHGPWLGWGATLLVLGLLVRSVAVCAALVSCAGRRVVRGWLLAAELCLWAGLGLAAALVAERLGSHLLPSRMTGIGLHAGWLLAGWVGGWMIALGSLLLPMFAVAPEPRPAVLGTAGVLWYAGLAAAWPPLWAAGALIAAGALLYSLSRRVRRVPEAAIVGATLGLTGLGAVAVAVLAGVEAPQVVAIALLCWVLPFFRGVALRILPFLAWVHLLGDQGGRAPAVGTLLSPRLAAVAVVAGVGAGALVLAGGALGRWEVARMGAGLGALGSVCALVLVLRAVARGFAARRRGLALPGMEGT